MRQRYCGLAVYPDEKSDCAICWLSGRNAISAEAYKPFMNDIDTLVKLAERFEKAAESGRGVKAEQEVEVRYSVENSFDEQVDNALNGKTNKRNALFVSETSDVLLSVGMKQLPMLYTQSHLKNAIKPKNKNNIQAHGLTVEQIKYMPQIIKHPAIIMDSLSSNEDIVLISDKLDNDGAPIILAVHPNGNGVYELITQPSNFIKSYYGKDNDFKGYIQRAISNDKILYIDKNKSQSLYQQIGLQLPNGFNKLGFDKIIHLSNNIVNNNSMQKNENSAEQNKLIVINKNKAKNMLTTIGIQPSEVSRILNLSNNSLSQGNEDVNGETRSDLRYAIDDVIDFTSTKLNRKKESTPYGQQKESIRSGMLSNNTVPYKSYNVNNNSMQENENNANIVKYAIDDEFDISDKDIKTLRTIGRKSINDFTSEDIQKSEKWARMFYKELRTKSHNAIGNKEAIQYLPYIKDIVNKSILFDTYCLDKPKSSNSLFMHSFYAVADIGNGNEVLKLYVEEMNDPNSDNTLKRAYQLKNIEKWQFAVTGSANKTLSRISQTANIDTVSDLFAVVKQLDNNFSPKSVNPVVLNDDGTPKVFYHGTSENFIEFRAEEMNIREGSYFFAENREDTEAYGNNVMQVYLTGEKLADYDNQPSEFYKLQDIVHRNGVYWKIRI